MTTELKIPFHTLPKKAEKISHVERKVVCNRKILILAHSGAGKTFYAQRKEDVLDLDAFVYPTESKAWKHFSFVPDFIKSNHTVFAVAHDVDAKIESTFDQVVETKDVQFKVSIEQVLSTYIRDSIRGFKITHIDLSLDGITFTDYVSQIREEYPNSTFEISNRHFSVANFLLHRYNEKQNGKYNFLIDIIGIKVASRKNDIVSYDGDSVYTVTYCDVDYIVKVKSQKKKYSFIIRLFNQRNHTF